MTTDTNYFIASIDKGVIGEIEKRRGNIELTYNKQAIVTYKEIPQIDDPNYSLRRTCHDNKYYVYIFEKTTKYEDIPTDLVPTICDFLDGKSLESYSRVAKAEHKAFCNQMRKKYKKLKDEIKTSDMEAELKRCGNRTIIELSVGEVTERVMDLLRRYPIDGISASRLGDYNNPEMYPNLCSFHSMSPFRFGDSYTKFEDVEYHGETYNDFLHLANEIQNQHYLRVLSISQKEDYIDGTLWRHLFTNLGYLRNLQIVKLTYPPPILNVKSWHVFPQNVKLELNWKSLGNPKDSPLPPPTVNIERLTINLQDYFPHALRKEVYPTIKFLRIFDRTSFIFFKNVSGFTKIIQNVPNLEELEIPPIPPILRKKILKIAPNLKKLNEEIIQ